MSCLRRTGSQGKRTCTAPGMQRRIGRRSVPNSSNLLGSLSARHRPATSTTRASGVALTVHGGDSTVSGPEEDFKWLETFIAARWEIKATILGPEGHHAQEMNVLNRSIRWTARGLEYEADQRHRQVVLKELELEHCKPVTTPWGPQEQGCLREDTGGLLSGTEATKFRAVVARLNYLAMDRPDIQYATKECSKRMAHPISPTGCFSSGWVCTWPGPLVLCS